MAAAEEVAAAETVEVVAAVAAEAAERAVAGVEAAEAAEATDEPAEEADILTNGHAVAASVAVQAVASAAALHTGRRRR